MPDGSYAIVRFKSSFEKLPKATEYVTVIQEKDESWKVVGIQSKRVINHTLTSVPAQSSRA